MNYRRDVWYSPRKILLRAAQEETKLGAAFKKSPKYKAVIEARAVALMLLGIEKIQGREYWLQIVDPVEQSPDIRTATHMIETDNRLAYQDVEVVTLESHSPEDIDDFLKRTKLSSEKSYQEDTIILCYIDKNMATKPWSEINKALAALGRKYDIYVLGRTDAVEQNYQLVRVYPSIDHMINYDAMEEAKKSARDTMRFERGTVKKASRDENENHEPF
jgi:hypothetical protein